MAEGFQTTALCTTGTVSLGSRGRCFFKAGVLEAGEEDEEEEGGVAVALDTGARLMVEGEGAVKESMVTGMAIGETLEGVVLF